MPEKSLILCILDGWGIAPDSAGNAITRAHPQTFNYLSQNYPQTRLEASGPQVGLPENQDGNSETGHLNIGAGRIVYQDLALINMSIADGSFFVNKALLDTVKHVRSYRSRLHLIGMIGNSGVHSYNEHLFALLLFASRHHLEEVYLHLITDGRDSPPENSLEQIQKVEDEIKKFGVGEISSILGRYYAMDRDKRLDRTKIAYDCLFGKGKSSALSPQEFIKSNYQKQITDEFILPSSIGSNPSESRIKPADAVIFFNFRTDRPRQLTEMILNSGVPNLKFVSMTRYRNDFDNPVLFPTTTVTHTLGEIISSHRLNQLRAAETEKIAMVTYYFNGQSEIAFAGESHLFVPSPKIATYDLKPEMSSELLADQFMETFKQGNFKLAVINIACPDMVAHTGKIDKAIEAIKATDVVLAKLVNLSKETGSFLMITADHGNAEELLNPNTGEIDTEHSTSKVPLIIYHPEDNHFKLAEGKLGDIAPSILSLLELPQPSEMTGNNLIVR
jgi:2,3-bisphosphoglycerate-independent phosphoglycerate mutase